MAVKILRGAERGCRDAGVGTNVSCEVFPPGLLSWDIFRPSGIGQRRAGRSGPSMRTEVERCG